MKKLSPMDYLCIALETPESPMHVTALQIFEIPEDYRGNFTADLVNELLERREVGPPLNYKLKPALIGLPSWEELEDVDLEYHIRHSALPKPGTLHELWHLVSRLTSRLLDRSRPMWELYVIEGLEGNRFALYIKMHHAFIDGATGVRMVQAMLSESPEDTEVRGIWEFQKTPKRRRRPPTSPLAQLAKTVQGVQGQLQTLPELAGLFLRRGLQLSGANPGHLATPFTAPRTPFNASLTAARRNAGVSLPLAQMKAVGKSVGASLNEVLLTTVDMAFNRYLRERDALPERPLVAETAMDLRQPGKEVKSSNVVALLFMNMGQPDADPITRLRQVHQSSNATKEEARSMSTESLMNFTLIPQAAAQLADKLGIAHELPAIANIGLSNVKGLTKSYYLKGARLQHLFPAPPILPGMAMTIITSSYVDTIDVGMSSDRDAVPELEDLAAYIGEAFEELEAAALAKQKAAIKPGKTAAKDTKAAAAPEPTTS